jgi:hypothetical protein
MAIRWLTGEEVAIRDTSQRFRGMTRPKKSLQINN